MNQNSPSQLAHGNPEGRYLSGPGKPLTRHISDLRQRQSQAAVKDGESRDALSRAERVSADKKHGHRGGDRPWWLRAVIPVAVAAEGVTAYVGVAALVDSQSLALGLSALTAFVGAGTACILANRRLNQLPVPVGARVLEGVFVLVLSALRYASLRIVGVGLLTAGGAAGLALLISGLALAGIEEVVFETHTFGVFVSSLRVSCARWRQARAAASYRRIAARIAAVLAKVEQDFLNFLLRTQDFPLGEAATRAAALKAAMTRDEG